MRKKYFTTSHYNKIKKEILDPKIKEKRLVAKSDISNLVKKSDLITKPTVLATKAELKVEQDKIIKLHAFSLNYFHGKSRFKDDGTQNYLNFQPVLRYFQTFVNSDNISPWKSKRLPHESIKPPATSNISLDPSLNYIYTKRQLKLGRNCLKQANVTFTHRTVANVYNL